MQKPKPTLQQENPFMDASFSFNAYEHPDQNTDSHWHYHRVPELIYISKGTGKKYVGNNFSYFGSGDLFMIGPLLPHYSFIDPPKPGQTKYSIQLSEGFPGVSMLMMPEMQPVKNLLERASFGISFHGKTKLKVGRKIENLDKYNPLERFIKVLVILKDLALSEEYNVLNASEFQIEVIPQDYARLQVIFNFVRENFRRQISLDEVAEKASLTAPSFARYFKKVTGKTFTNFVNQYRLLHASKLLTESEMSIMDVCFESGFNNFSHFNKLFRNYSGKTPSAYRNEIRQVVSR